MGESNEPSHGNPSGHPMTHMHVGPEVLAIELQRQYCPEEPAQAPSKRTAFRRFVRGHSQKIKSVESGASDLKRLFWFGRPKLMLRVFR
jgi:hypothetical protein